MDKEILEQRVTEAAGRVFEFIYEEFGIFDKCIWQSVSDCNELTQYGYELYENIKECIEQEIIGRWDRT